VAVNDETGTVSVEELEGMLKLVTVGGVVSEAGTPSPCPWGT
jgi:hypothetical protein